MADSEDHNKIEKATNVTEKFTLLKLQADPPYGCTNFSSNLEHETAQKDQTKIRGIHGRLVFRLGSVPLSKLAAPVRERERAAPGIKLGLEAGRCAAGRVSLWLKRG